MTWRNDGIGTTPWTLSRWRGCDSDPAPVEGIGIVTRVWQCAKLLGEDRRRVLAAAGADSATLDLLSVLRCSGPPYRLTTRELTERTRVTAGAISQRVSRAEHHGFVERTPEVKGLGPPV